MITVAEFSELYPRCKNAEEWVNAMDKLFPQFKINTAQRIAAFISQCGHESAGWKTFEENLNYSSRALDVVFPKYFKNAGRNAEEYHRQPEKIANIVYANRMGNGNTESGDGWRYRGRGPIQITGYNNYNAFSIYSGVGSIEGPNIVTFSPEVGLFSALWYWEKNNLNMYADNGDIKGLTKRINGAYIGLEDRIALYKEISYMLTNYGHDVDDLDENEEPTEDFDFGVLKRGSRGEGVVVIQEILGLKADGWFGKNTEAAVKSWQRDNDLYPDGIVGPKTLEKML